MSKRYRKALITIALLTTKTRRALTAALFALAGAAQPASAVLIDFDNLAAGDQNGNVLAASGVTFATGNIPNAIVAPFTFSNFDPRFSIFASSAVSRTQHRRGVRWWLERCVDVVLDPDHGHQRELRLRPR